MRTTLAVACLLILAGAARAAEPEVVTFKTEDRLKITGDFWATGKKGGPGVVALHMYPADRTSWQPVAAMFHEAGIDFLAVDMRGYGDSAKQGKKALSEKVRKRDARHFRAMYRDALAARAFLIERGVDSERVAFLGASVGCSVAIDAAARESRVRGAIVMTPGTKYLGVETMKHLKGYGKRPLLILSSKEEAGAGADAISKALGKTAELRLFDETGVHGTNMFGKVSGVESMVVEWMTDLLAPAILIDGTVSDDEASRGNFGEWDMMEEGKAKMTLRAVGRNLYFALRLDPPGSGANRLILAWAPDGKAERAHRVVLQWGRHGPEARLEAGAGRWKIVKGAFAKEARLGGCTGKSVEMLIPMTLPGLEPEANLKVAFAFTRASHIPIAYLPSGDSSMRNVERWLDFGL
jgi:pimeloyl-ACP methyl ester carboxylesterase